MRRMKEGGIGGFELAVVYPMALDDPASRPRNERYLSPEFLDKVRFAARKARELGLRMDVTIGSGWSYGGPYITPDLAAARLRSDRREITPDVTSRGAAGALRERPAGRRLRRAAARSRRRIRERFRELDVSGSRAHRAARGRAGRAWSSSTSRATAARSSSGPPLGRRGLRARPLPAAPPSRRTCAKRATSCSARPGPGGVHSIFCDSLEVYDADWTADMLEQFRTRRGYDLRPLLPLSSTTPATARSKLAARLRAHAQRALRGALPGAAARVGDEEQRPPPDPELRRAAGHALQLPPRRPHRRRGLELPRAHVVAVGLVRLAPLRQARDHLRDLDVAALARRSAPRRSTSRRRPTSTSCPASTSSSATAGRIRPRRRGRPAGPSTRRPCLTDKNPWWPVMPDLAAYLHRLSFVLRQGEPVVDVALYAPTEDAWATFRPGASHEPVPQDRGAGRARTSCPASSTRATASTSSTTARSRRRRRGATRRSCCRACASCRRRRGASWPTTRGRAARVIAVRRKPDGEWPSLEVVAEADLSSRLAAARPARRRRSSRPRPRSASCTAASRDADVYFLANTSNAPRSVTARFRAQTPNAELWDAFTGKVEGLHVRERGDRARLRAVRHARRRLPARSASDAPRRPHDDLRRRTIENLRSGWTVSFGAPGSGAAVELPHSWADDPRHAPLLGHGRPTSAASPCPPASARPAARVLLDFGDARAIEPRAAPGRHPARQLLRGPGRAADPRGGDRLRQRPPRGIGVGAALPRRPHRCSCGTGPTRSASTSTTPRSTVWPRAGTSPTPAPWWSATGSGSASRTSKDCGPCHRGYSPCHGSWPRGRSGDGGPRERDELRQAPVAGRGGGEAEGRGPPGLPLQPAGRGPHPHQHRRRQHLVEARREGPAHRRRRRGAVGEGLGGRPPHGPARRVRLAVPGEGPVHEVALSRPPASGGPRRRSRTRCTRCTRTASST